jgi:hypothetical protein
VPSHRSLAFGHGRLGLQQKEGSHAFYKFQDEDIRYRNDSRRGWRCRARPGGRHRDLAIPVSGRLDLDQGLGDQTFDHIDDLSRRGRNRRPVQAGRHEKQLRYCLVLERGVSRRERIHASASRARQRRDYLPT